MGNYFIFDEEPRSVDLLVKGLVNQGANTTDIIINEAEKTFRAAVEGILHGGFSSTNSVSQECLSKLLKIDARCKPILLVEENQSVIEQLDSLAVDFLLKPLKTSQIEQKIAKHFSLQQPTSDQQELSVEQDAHTRQKYSSQSERLFLQETGRIRILNTRDIRFIKAAGSYVEITLESGKRILHREVLKSIEKKLCNKGFSRIHRSALVRVDIISEIRSSAKGTLKVRTGCGEEFPVSKLKKELLHLIGNAA